MNHLARSRPMRYVLAAIIAPFFRKEFQMPGFEKLKEAYNVEELKAQAQKYSIGDNENFVNSLLLMAYAIEYL